MPACGKMKLRVTPFTYTLTDGWQFPPNTHIPQGEASSCSPSLQRMTGERKE